MSDFAPGQVITCDDESCALYLIQRTNRWTEQWYCMVLWHEAYPPGFASDWSIGKYTYFNKRIA